MFGHFRFSHMSGILWECGTAERGKYRFECPNASSGEKIWQPALPKPVRSASCALHMVIHPGSRRSSYFFVPFLFIVIEPGCSRTFLFIIWLSNYLHSSLKNQSPFFCAGIIFSMKHFMFSPFGVRRVSRRFRFLECGASPHRFRIFWIAARLVSL